MLYLIYLVIFLVLYFFPTRIGLNKKRASGIFVLNVFLGWTFIGWVVALIWAVSDSKKDKNETKTATIFKRIYAICFGIAMILLLFIIIGLLANVLLG